MFKYIKIRDRARSKIVEITQEGRVIKVNFYDGGNDVFITEGKKFLSDKYPTVYWDKIKFNIPKKLLPKLKVDTKVIVWDTKKGKKFNMYFKEFDEDDKIICFGNGATS